MEVAVLRVEAVAAVGVAAGSAPVSDSCARCAGAAFALLDTSVLTVSPGAKKYPFGERSSSGALRDFIAQHPATVGSEVEGHVMHLLLEKQMTRFGQLYLLARP